LGASSARFLRPKKGNRDVEADVTTGLGVREEGGGPAGAVLGALIWLVAVDSEAKGRFDAEAFFVGAGRCPAGADSLPRLSPGSEVVERLL
jgi:hypothetical protein